MTDILVTLQYGSGKLTDLALPQHAPSQLLAYSVADGLGVSHNSNQIISLGRMEGTKVTKLKDTNSLRQSRVMNGAFLKLLVEPVPKKAAFLTTASGLRLLVDDDCLIGRSGKGVTAQIDLGSLNRFVSREHARIQRNKAGYQIEDLESKNGTYVNDKKLESNKPLPLKDGDTVRFGTQKNGISLIFKQRS
jgi:pSer/pThr/pTyr-binding forkhead associated (FHA) protein